MNDLIDRYGSWLAAIIIALAGLLVLVNLPDMRDYRVGADEGIYYRQGEMLVEHGVGDGLAQIAKDYIATPAQQDFPNPLRIATILAVAFALDIDDSYQALSCLSLLGFLLLLVCVWRFASHHWSRSQALASVVLLAASPLALGMARRALMDSIACTASALSLFAFLRLLEGRGRRPLAAFAALTTFAILVKETAVLLLPFYTMVLVYYRLRRELPLDWRRLALAVLLPPLLAGLVWLAAYGPDALIAIIGIVRKVAATQIEYVVDYSQGPWYRYLVDFVALSPWTFLLAAIYAGYLLRVGNDRWMTLLLALAVYLLCAYAPLTKNARYLLLLDLPIRCLAAAMLLALPGLLQSFWRRVSVADANPGAPWKPLRWLPVLAIGLVLATDVAAFQRYFVAGGIYDPVTYNLLRADHIVPPLARETGAETHGAAAIALARAGAMQEPDADHYIELAFQYCAGGLPLECSWASREAVRLSPHDAGAYNNLCAAYNGLREWQNAVAACREALKLQPDFALAQNNLRWALNQSGANQPDANKSGENQSGAK